MSVRACRQLLDQEGLIPADLDGAQGPATTAGLFARQFDDELHTPGTADPTQDFIEIYELTPNFAAPPTARCWRLAITLCLTKATSTPILGIRDPMILRSTPLTAIRFG